MNSKTNVGSGSSAVVMANRDAMECDRRGPNGWLIHACGQAHARNKGSNIVYQMGLHVFVFFVGYAMRR